MAKLELSLETASALYHYANRVISGENVADGEDKRAFTELREQLERVVGEVRQWTSGRSNNLFISGCGWKVSYKIASDSGKPETALIDRNTGQYYMLSGDHRRAYEEVASQGWDALFGVYSSLKDEFPHED